MSTQNKNRTNGVLPITAAATKKAIQAQKPAQRAPAPKLRLIVRRLPPGLVESEFWDALGLEWKVGQGNVDWFAYKNGKVSKDPSKPSRPARAYLKVKDQSLIESLSAKIRSTQFKDAKNTITDPSLVGPPSLEFAPYNKTPGGRVRNDGRQGTIDQDFEFVNFLQSLTEPITKPALANGEASDAKLEKVTTTPLVQFIKEKKANKAKEKEAAAAAKTAKKAQETKDAKTKSKGEAKSTIIVKSSASNGDKSRSGKPSQDSAKSTEKASNTTQTKASNLKPEQKAKDSLPPTAMTATTATPKKERERGNASAAAKMISRDLGLTPKEPRASRAAKNTAPSNNETKAEPAKVTVTTSSADSDQPKSASAAPLTSTPPAGPKNKSSSNQAQKSRQTQPAPQTSQKATSQQTSGAKSAFLKHANPSQGITEELLRTAFSEYGDITRCDIDKKKGLAYIDFVNPESLKKAIAASPVKVASGQVVVLENRSPYRKTAQQRGPANAGNTPETHPATPTTPEVSSPQPRKATVSSTPIVTKNKAASNIQEEATTITTPVEQVSATAGGRGGSKGSRGGKTTQPTENGKTGSGTRGTGRGGSRGNRNRGGRGANAQNAAAASPQTTTPATPANQTAP